MALQKTKKKLTIDAYQRQALQTDQFTDIHQSISNSLANLIEEVGALHRWYQQDTQQKNDLRLFRKKAPGKIGDILWYLASVANRVDESLNDIAQANLDKAAHRWGKSRNYKLFDEDYPEGEQLPRKCDFKIRQTDSGQVELAIQSDAGPLKLGNVIDDNAHEDDGYRFHDVFHIAYAAYLGWSPVLRALLKRKRKSVPEVDVVEDGARAGDLEEALTAFIYEHAKSQEFFEGQTVLDFKLLKVVERLTMTREVRERSPQYWQEAILNGYIVFRKVVKNRGGIVSMDLNKRVLSYRSLTERLPRKKAKAK